MNLLDRATDWTNQSVEERAEACAAFLCTYRFIGIADNYRTQNQIRARADIQREQRAKGTAMADRPTRNCTLCDDTGYKDYAGFGMDPCDHQKGTAPADNVIEAMAKAHCDFFGGKGWWDTGLIADTKPQAFDAMRAALAALQSLSDEERFDHARLTYAGMMAAMRAVAETGVMEALDLAIFRGYVHGQEEERAKRDAARKAWNWLAQNPSHELSYEGWEEDEWHVHRVNGPRSDREWTLVARGQTPLVAIQAAMALGALPEERA